MSPLFIRNKQLSHTKFCFNSGKIYPLNCVYYDLKTVGKNMTGQNKSAVQKPGLVEQPSGLACFNY